MASVVAVLKNNRAGKIDFDISKWKFIEFGFGNLDWLISPKELNKKRGENEL